VYTKYIVSFRDSEYLDPDLGAMIPIFEAEGWRLDNIVSAGYNGQVYVWMFRR